MVPRGTACLVRAVTVDGDAVHDPALTMVIVDRVVLDATVVPKGNCVGAPAEAAGEFGPYQVGVEIVEERRALFFAHAAKADRESAVDEQPLAPGFGMRADNGVLDFGLCGIAAPDVHRALCRKPIRSRAIWTTRAVHRSHAVEHAFHAVGERVVGQIHTGEQRITPEIGDRTGVEDRTQRRLFEVGDVRVPGTPEIAAVILGLFSDLDDFRVVGHSADKLVDIQAAKAAAESQMLLRCQILIAEKDRLMVEQRPADVGNHGVVERLAQIDPRELGAESSGDAAHVKCPIAHRASHRIVGRSPALGLPRTACRAASLAIFQSASIGSRSVAARTLSSSTLSTFGGTLPSSRRFVTASSNCLRTAMTSRPTRSGAPACGRRSARPYSCTSVRSSPGPAGSRRTGYRRTLYSSALRGRGRSRCACCTWS